MTTNNNFELLYQSIYEWNYYIKRKEENGKYVINL